MMIKSKLGRVALTCAALASAGGAQAFTALNWHDVNQVDKNTFEVIAQVRTSPADYWCGAGDYAVRVLGAATATPVYLVRGPGPAVTVQGRTSVQFSLTPPKDGNFTKGYSLNIKQVGDNLTANFARNYCSNNLFLEEF